MTDDLTHYRCKDCGYEFYHEDNTIEADLYYRQNN